jgi:hypothetical protein
MQLSIYNIYLKHKDSVEHFQTNDKRGHTAVHKSDACVHEQPANTYKTNLLQK